MGPVFWKSCSFWEQHSVLRDDSIQSLYDPGNGEGNLGNQTLEVDPNLVNDTGEIDGNTGDNEASALRNDEDHSDTGNQSPPFNQAGAELTGTKPDELVHENNGEVRIDKDVHLVPPMDGVPSSSTGVNSQVDHGRHESAIPQSGRPQVGDDPPDIQEGTQDLLGSGNAPMFPPQSSSQSITRAWQKKYCCSHNVRS